MSVYTVRIWRRANIDECKKREKISETRKIYISWKSFTGEQEQNKWELLQSHDHLDDGYCRPFFVRFFLCPGIGINK